MLRITRTQNQDAVLYRLEGKLTGPWVDEFASALAVETVPLSKIHFDLTAVAFVDSTGVEFLRSLLVQGARIGQRSDYVAALLEVEGS